MPVIPCQYLGLCKKAKDIATYTSKTFSSKSKKFSLITLIIIELISIIMNYYNNNAYFSLYPLFVNITMINLCYYIYTNRRLLKLCQISTIALRFVIFYYFFNIISVLFDVEIYYTIVSISVLFISFLLFLLSIFKNK